MPRAVGCQARYGGYGPGWDPRPWPPSGPRPSEQLDNWVALAVLGVVHARGFQDGFAAESGEKPSHPYSALGSRKLKFPLLGPYCVVGLGCYGDTQGLLGTSCGDPLKYSAHHRVVPGLVARASLLPQEAEGREGRRLFVEARGPAGGSSNYGGGGR